MVRFGRVRAVVLLLGLLASAFAIRSAGAQPGTVLSFLKHNSASLAPSSITIDNDDELGSAVAWLGDLDGAGPSVAAVAVGAIGDDDGGLDQGAVHILFLNSAGAVLSKSKIAEGVGGFTGTLDALDDFGGSIAWLGDLDGAGASVGAIAVGAAGDDDGGANRGAVYVLRLNAAGAVVGQTKLVTTQVGLPLGFPANDEEYGGAVAWLGDLDGAGPSVAAIAVGAIGDDNGGEDRGAVFIVYLSSTGAFLSFQKISSTTGGFSATLDDFDMLGNAVAPLGDLDGASPGVKSLAVGVSNDDDGGMDSGAVYLLHLLANGTVSSWHKISRTVGGLTAPVANLDNFGAGVAALGDLDGAGTSPTAIAVGATGDDGPGTDRGAVYILFLSSTNAVLSHQEISTTAGGSFGAQLGDLDEFGGAIGAVGDLDGAGAGALTLVAGVGFDDDGGNDRGAAYFLNLNGPALQAPVVSAPATASGPENSLLTVNVTASDADGPAISSLTASGLPAGATFTPGPGNTTGSLTWTPTFAQSGVYVVTFIASNTLADTTTTEITITNVDRAPVVAAPTSVPASEGQLVTFVVHAADPDGQGITSLVASNLPSGATFTPAPGDTVGTFNWTPTFAQSGNYTVTFTANNALSGSANTDVNVGNLDLAPIVVSPTSLSVNEGELLTFVVHAEDPDGQAITSLIATNRPTGATFTRAPGDTVGTFSWTPTFSQSGTYNVKFIASNSLADTTVTEITVTHVDQAPVVTAWTTAWASAGLPLAVVCTVSDPDGDPITSLTCQNLPAGASFTPSPNKKKGQFDWIATAEQVGQYTITFVASNVLQDTASTQITVGLPSTGVGPGAALHHPVVSPIPMRTRGTLSFATAEAGDIRVELLDLSGRLVRKLLSERDSPAGLHHVVLDGTGDRGEQLAPGVYLYRIRAPRLAHTGRVVIVR